MPCSVPPDGGERALREVAQVYERIKIQHPLLLLNNSSSQPPSTTAHLAQNLLGEALRALNVALSVMKQQPAVSDAGAVTTPGTKAAEPQLSSPSPDVAAAATMSTATRGKRKRSSVMEGKNSSSWVDFTIMPYEDGYEWRKYGEKNINGTSYTKSYFRCSYKDAKGCMATKHIQQQDNADPPMFQVTYNNDHTCNTSSPANKRKNSSNGNRLPFPAGYYYNGEEGAINNLPNSDGHAAMVNQEPPWFPIIPNQAVVHVATVHHAGMPPSMITSTNSSSCITGLSSTEYSADMAAVEDMEPAAGYNDPLRDLEFFLMHDTDAFKY